MRSHLVILNGPNTLGNHGILHKGKRWWMSWRFNVWCGGRYTLNAYLASKILDLFKEVEGNSNAHGMGVSCGDTFHINLIVITSCSFNFGHQGWVAIQAQGTHNYKHMGTRNLSHSDKRWSTQDVTIVVKLSSLFCF
jgi:hypothetical protein